MDSEALNLRIDILEPTRVLDGHLQYRDQVKIRIDVERLGFRFKEVVLADPCSIQLPGNHLSDPSQLILHATASCASCTTQAFRTGRKCSPMTFRLIPSIEGVLMSFDDYNTRYSRVTAFKIPHRYRRPTHGQWSRCSDESLMHVFCLMASSTY